MGSHVSLVDSGAETAKMVAEDLRKRRLLNLKTQDGQNGSVKYFVTDSIEGFSALASKYLEAEVNGMVEQVTLE
jgi:glutamate racemase